MRFKWKTVLNYFVLVVICKFDTGKGQESEYTYQSYQRSMTCTSLYEPREPRSLTEIQDIVRYAIAHKINVKAVGNLHSIQDSICTSGIPIKLTHITHFSYNSVSEVATVGAGIEAGIFFEKLHIYGRGVYGIPMYGGITLGGAIANGAHGTGQKYASTLSQQIVAVTLVDGRGKVRRVTKDDEDFKAFRVNLGLLGIIYEVEIATVPQYKLHIRNYPINDGIIWNGGSILEMAKDYDHFQFFWYPTNKQIILSVGNRVPVHVPGNCETRMITEMSSFTSNTFSTVIEGFQKIRDDIGLFHVQSYSKLSMYKEMPARDPVFVEEDGETACLHGNAIGYGHRMLANTCKECYWKANGKPLLNDDSSVVIPLEKLMPALRTLGEIFEKHMTQIPLSGIFVRFLTPGDAYMAINEGEKDWAAIEWNTPKRWDVSYPKMGLSAFQIMGQVLIEQYGGRPHWGKNGLYYTNPDIIRKSHPNLDKFIAVMNKYDPEELFMNTFGERIKHGNNRVTVASDIAEHCAVNEVCVCKSNYDCGKEGPLDYTCGRYLGFPKYNACLAGPIEQMKGLYSRPIIELMATLEYNEDSVINYLGQYNSLKQVMVRKKKKISKYPITSAGSEIENLALQLT